MSHRAIVLDALESIVPPLELELYAGLQQQAVQRIAVRDADDWPVLACAMMIGCPAQSLANGAVR